MATTYNSVESLPGELMDDIELHTLNDDGMIPNNTLLPLVVYRRALDLGGGDREERVRELFRVHGWENSWVNGIYAYQHYHSTAHEVLGIARGVARVKLGGPQGITTDVEAGDAILIPAGVAHCLIESESLSVVGAYPKGQDWDLCRPNEQDRERALRNIPLVPLPENDPVFGAEGPVHDHWRG